MEGGELLNILLILKVGSTSSYPHQIDFFVLTPICLSYSKKYWRTFDLKFERRIHDKSTKYILYIRWVLQLKKIVLDSPSCLFVFFFTFFCFSRFLRFLCFLLILSNTLKLYRLLAQGTKNFHDWHHHCSYYCCVFSTWRPVCQFWKWHQLFSP